MPRTIEGIVEAHQLATARRAKGLSPWKGELTFMRTLSPLCDRFENGDGTLTAQQLLDGFHAAAKEVRSKVPEAQGPYFKGEDDDLEYFVLTLEELTLASLEAHEDILEEVNEALDRLYDWSDRNRWWVHSF